MAAPIYASPLERAWRYGYLADLRPDLLLPDRADRGRSSRCRFNAEPYFTFTDEMLALDPAGYSLRWYDSLLTFGMTSPDGPRDGAWWADVWTNAAWVNAAKNSSSSASSRPILATTLGTLAALGLSRPEMPFRRVDHGAC